MLTPFIIANRSVFVTTYHKHSDTIDGEYAMVRSSEGNAEIAFFNPFTDEFEAVLLKCRSAIEVEFELLSDFTVIGNFKNISLSVTDFEAYF